MIIVHMTRRPQDTVKMTREDALQFFYEGMMGCEGSEQERMMDCYDRIKSGEKEVWLYR